MNQQLSSLSGCIFVPVISLEQRSKGERSEHPPTRNCKRTVNGCLRCSDISRLAICSFVLVVVRGGGLFGEHDLFAMQILVSVW